MYISQIVAQAIVDEIGREIREHVNLMDSQGYIIASTDPARIGVLHEGAKRIIREKLPALYITSEMETSTTRKGINLPITIRGEIVGVVGITGEKERVEGYGNIVRRMTEIMVGDSMAKDRHRYDRRVRYRFMEEWIGKTGAVYDRNFAERGKRLGIDIDRARRALVIHFERYQELSDTQEGQRRLEEMEASIRHFVEKGKDILYLREPPKQICLMRACADERLRELAGQLSRLIREKYGETVLIGIDSEEAGSTQISQICEEAEKAAESCRSGEREIVFYRELDTELFIGEISEETMKRYLGKLLPGVDDQELDACMVIISVYFEKDGSIAQMAEALFMHKNTIQYKLKKLETISGVDIRTPRGSAVYYMALSFYKRLYGGAALVRSS